MKQHEYRTAIVLDPSLVMPWLNDQGEEGFEFKAIVPFVRVTNSPNPQMTLFLVVVQREIENDGDA